MRRDAHILLICDDEVASHEVTHALGTELTVSQTLEGVASLSFVLRYEPVILGAAWEISLRDRHYDLCIVAARGDAPARFPGGDVTARSQVAATLFLVDGTLQARGAWSLRPRSDRVLARPFSDRELALAVERLLLGSLEREARTLPDGDLLVLLKGVVGENRRVLAPSLVPGHPDGARWPDVAKHLGPLVDESGALERLTGMGMARRTLRNRLRVCPACESFELAYGETCAGCGSVDFVQETMIHHFACATVDTVAAFRRGNDLICPKCVKPLRQIGRDYEKPANLFRCRACAAVTSDTRVVATCLNCRGQCKPEETRERLIHAYELTPLADEAIAAGNLGGFDLASVLRDSGNGLYARSFVVYELTRELARFRRYAAACSLVMTRLTGLSEIRMRRPERTADYIQALARAVTQELRDLDLTAVWSGDTLATLLPMTDAAGAAVVATRIESAARRCSAAFELDLVGVTVSRASAGPGLDNTEAMVRACNENLSADGTSIVDQFVILDDETVHPT
ncbi:MAG TPA: diguanylate cyclase [Planctomycetota bacterium]|nr:diguanylate cyclase [Planctomycetota bacterium]